MIKKHWFKKSFSQLSVEELYGILKLRADIFVVEQNCVYSDLDSDKNCLDRHPETIHLLCYEEVEHTGDFAKSFTSNTLGNHSERALIAYLRILPKGQTYPEHISIGRVVTAQHVRGKGVGHELLAQGLSLCLQYFPNEPIKISAQEHLKGYYGHHGFEQVSGMYLEDGIPHIAMVK